MKRLIRASSNTSSKQDFSDIIKRLIEIEDEIDELTDKYDVENIKVSDALTAAWGHIDTARQIIQSC